MSKVYEVITGQIVEQLERGVVPWARPWKVDGLAPSNLISRRPYRGINVFLLGFRAASTPWWLTFRQAKALGGTVRAGERSTPVVFWALPEGLSFDGEESRTPLACPLFNDIEETSQQVSEMVDQITLSSNTPGSSNTLILWLREVAAMRQAA
jgi:antirestriction protein ArdC